MRVGEVGNLGSGAIMEFVPIAESSTKKAKLVEIAVVDIGSGGSVARPQDNPGSRGRESVALEDQGALAPLPGPSKPMPPEELEYLMKWWESLSTTKELPISRRHWAKLEIV